MVSKYWVNWWVIHKTKCLGDMYWVEKLVNFMSLGVSTLRINCSEFIFNNNLKRVFLSIWYLNYDENRTRAIWEAAWPPIKLDKLNSSLYNTLDCWTSDLETSFLSEMLLKVGLKEKIKSEFRLKNAGFGGCKSSWIYRNKVGTQESKWHIIVRDAFFVNSRNW